MEINETFEIKRDVMRKYLIKEFTADECVKILGDVYDVIKYKQDTELALRGGWLHAN